MMTYIPGYSTNATTLYDVLALKSGLNLFIWQCSEEDESQLKLIHSSPYDASRANRYVLHVSGVHYDKLIECPTASSGPLSSSSSALPSIPAVVSGGKKKVEKEKAKKAQQKLLKTQQDLESSSSSSGAFSSVSSLSLMPKDKGNTNGESEWGIEGENDELWGDAAREGALGEELGSTSVSATIIAATPPKVQRRRLIRLCDKPKPLSKDDVSTIEAGGGGGGRSRSPSVEEAQQMIEKEDE